MQLADGQADLTQTQRDRLRTGIRRRAGLCAGSSGTCTFARGLRLRGVWEAASTRTPVLGVDKIQTRCDNPRALHDRCNNRRMKHLAGEITSFSPYNKLNESLTAR